MTLEVILIAAALVLLVVLLAVQLRQPARVAQMLEQQHRAMLTDLGDGLNKQGDRLIAAQAAESERLRSAVGEELRATRDAPQYESEHHRDIDVSSGPDVGR